MDEPTTTVDAAPETGAVEALPAQNDTTTADAKTTVELGEASEGGDAPVPEADDKLTSFAKGQGIDDVSNLTDRERALLKSAYDSKADRDRLSSKASELEKSFVAKSDEIAEQVAETTGQDPETIKRLQRIEVKEAVRDFWDSNPDARKYEADMIKIVAERPHLAGDLDALYATAVIKSGGLDAVKSQGKREALENLAQKQQAAAPMGNATNSGTTPKSKPFNELSIAEMEAQLGFVRQ